MYYTCSSKLFTGSLDKHFPSQSECDAYMQCVKVLELFAQHLRESKPIASIPTGVKGQPAYTKGTFAPLGYLLCSLTSFPLKSTLTAQLAQLNSPTQSAPWRLYQKLEPSLVGSSKNLPGWPV